MKVTNFFYFFLMLIVLNLVSLSIGYYSRSKIPKIHNTPIPYDQLMLIGDFLNNNTIGDGNVVNNKAPFCHKTNYFFQLLKIK